MPDIDGIKKIEKAEVEKSRKIVLDSIRAVEKKAVETKGEAEPKTMSRPEKKPIQDIRPKKLLAAWLFPRKGPKPVAAIKAAARSINETVAKERKSVVGDKAMKLAASEKKLPKISDQDKALWQDDMKNLLKSEAVIPEKEAVQSKGDKMPENKPKAENAPAETEELVINKSHTKEEPASKIISNEDKKRFFSDIRDLSLLKKKSDDSVQSERKMRPERKIIIEHAEDDGEFDFSLNTYEKLKANESSAPDLIHDKVIGQVAARQPDKIAKKARVPLKIRLRGLTVRLADAWLDAKVYFLIALILFVTFYSFFAVITLKAGVDTGFTRWLAERMPVPAVITSGNIVEYYPYVDMREQYCRGVCSSGQKKDFKVWLVNRIIFYSLVDKYGLTDGKEIEAQIRKYVVFDEEINQVGINRIKKIKNMIDEGGNFYLIAQKSGDSFGQHKIGQIEGAIKDLEVDLSEIADKKTSRIVYGPDGYYLFYVDKEVSPESVAYVFVASRSFEDYQSEKLDGFRIWSLVD